MMEYGIRGRLLSKETIHQVGNFCRFTPPRPRHLLWNTLHYPRVPSRSSQPPLLYVTIHNY